MCCTSSSNSTAGRATISHAIATRRRSPPEISDTRVAWQLLRFNSVIKSATLHRRSNDVTITPVDACHVQKNQSDRKMSCIEK